MDDVKRVVDVLVVIGPANDDVSVFWGAITTLRSDAVKEHG